MKKIKGSLSAIRMSHLVVLFAVMAVSGLAIRTYQLLVMVNPTNGFFENANFTVPVLYGILAVGCVLFLALSASCSAVTFDSIALSKTSE